MLSLSGCESDSKSSATNVSTNTSTEPFPITYRPERLVAIGPQSCAECHPVEYDEWRRSHHALANRPVSAEADSIAFLPDRELTVNSRTYQLRQRDGAFIFSTDDIAGFEMKDHPLIGVIGAEPLLQYLVRTPNGAYQTTAVAYDPAKDEWFHVFPEDFREPGDYGHWTGHGMNWTANCAFCHMTEFEKGYDYLTQKYDSSWTQQGIACAQCHPNLDAHVAAARNGESIPVGTRLETSVAMENCASCHSRRADLTAGKFRPGDRYDDHYTLSLPDETGLYYEDGQIRDEVFVHGSFSMSSMHDAGVTCLDCHNPHTLEPILPVANNALCMRCHGTGEMEATRIDPIAHSFHREGSTGNQCVQCHMPKTTYMERDPRGDHQFLSPDPLMTRELGIPNACNQCHTDETVDWAIEHAEAWYGEKLAEKRQRQRAILMTSLRNGTADPTGAVRFAQEETNQAWRAALLGMLVNYRDDPTVGTFLRSQLKGDSSLIRQRALRALTIAAPPSALAIEAQRDPAKTVRIEAYNSLHDRREWIRDPQEYREYLEANADYIGQAFRLAEWIAEDGDAATSLELIEATIRTEPRNPDLLLDAGVLLARIGQNERSRECVEKAFRIDPSSVRAAYSLALIRAESGDTESARSLLRQAVQLDPTFHRAWYNLAILENRAGNSQSALEAIRRAAPGFSNDPQFDAFRRQIEAAAAARP